MTRKLVSKKIFIFLFLFINALNLILTFPSFAVVNTQYENQAQLLKKINVFVGTNQGFELDRTPTRLEGGILFVRLLGGNDEALTQKYSHPFKDVPTWGDPYVGYLWHHGLTRGVSSTEYGSTLLMQGKSYLTFTLTALGYVINKDFTWTTAVDKSLEIGLIDNNLYQELYNSTFLRDHVAKLSYDALKQSIKDNSNTLADQLIDTGAIDLTLANEIGITKEDTDSTTNIHVVNSPVSKLTTEDIKLLGANGFTGSETEIADAIKQWQINNMIYASSSENYPDVSYSMRWNYAFPNTYTVMDMLSNMKDGNKYYGICYHYAIIYAAIADYYGLNVRITNTTVKPSDVSTNSFYEATSKGLSLKEFEHYTNWITKKGLSIIDYPYEAVRLVMGETALHYRAEVNINESWIPQDDYNPVTKGSSNYDYIVTNWNEGYQKEAFDDYVNRLNNGEDLKGEGFSSAYEEFLEGRLIKIETGEAKKYIGITDDANQTKRASNIDELLQGLGLVPYFDTKEKIIDFFQQADWVKEEIDEAFEVKEKIETATGQRFYIICDLMIYSEVETIEYATYAEQYLAFSGEEINEDTFNNYIK
ncbi:hypothetical protein AN1V17_28460 [Vallitalea sediminicola]